MAENATSVTRMSTVRRTKVCDVVSARSSTNAKKRLPTRLERLGTTASNTQTAANKPRITSVWMPVRADSNTDIASTGPSSPQVPYARIESPTRVPVSERSRMMGTSVPSAVEVRASVTAIPSKWLTENHGVKRTASQAIPNVTTHVAKP